MLECCFRGLSNPDADEEWCVCVWRTVLRLTHYLHVEWPCGLVMMDYVCGDRIQCSQGRGLKEAA